ncbi:hypothetical protein BHM03_00039483 [Ensete ventricosum]|nr:hypothetical protein BHM03_00039483 [Ensete ventricosum]
MTNLIIQLADYSLLRHRSRTPRLMIIVVATLRHGSRTPRLLVINAATVRHGSRMPRWLGTIVSKEASWRRSRYGDEEEEPVAERSGHWPLEIISAEVLLWLGSSERWRGWLAAAGAGVAVATSDRLAAAEVAGGEEQ